MPILSNTSFLSASCYILTFLAKAQGNPLSTTNIAITNSSVPSTAGLLDPTIRPSKGGHAICASGIIPITVHTNSNVLFDYELPQNQSQLTQTFVDLWSIGSTFKDDITKGNHIVGGTFNISTTICFPPGQHSSKVHVLTHGIGFDRSYWDFALGYSYVDVAAEAGYATVLYDRLGVGMSEKADPLLTIQSPLELEILSELVQMARGGHLANTTFSTVIGVGHSFGSALTQGLVASKSSALDAAILTGFSTYHGGMPTFSIGQNSAIAALNQPYRFSHLSTGYTVVDTDISNQITFFHSPGFDPEILSLAAATKATTTLGEFFTTGNTVKPTTNFTGPVAVVDVEYDLGFCFGNCSYPVNRLEETVNSLFPALGKNKTNTFQVPMSGHGVNLHYTSGEAFAFIMGFLEKHGL